MKHVLAFALSAAALCACADAALPARTEAPHPSDTCVLLEQGTHALSGAVRMSDEQRTAMRAIHTEDLAPPTYQCGDASYQTDPNLDGLTFTGVGFSGNRRYAKLLLQAVAGPLAGTGYACLYEAKDESWELRGCDMVWIS